VAGQESPPADASPSATTPESASIGFAGRGRARRRARFLRKARELAYRDLGGLVFNLHRYGQRNDALVLAKLNTLTHIDDELRTLESALSERQPVTVLREAGITACPRCAAIHSGEDRFCPNCGMPISRHVDLPIAGQQAAGQPAAAPSAAGQPAVVQPAGQPAAVQPAVQPAAAQPTANQPTANHPAAAPTRGPAAGQRSSPPPAPRPQPMPAGTPVQANAEASGEDEQPTEIRRAPRASA
jgi:hypothetical protein